MQFLAPLVIAEPVALFTPQEPSPPVVPTAQNILEVTKVTGCNALPSVPAFVEVRSWSVHGGVWKLIDHTFRRGRRVLKVSSTSHP